MKNTVLPALIGAMLACSLPMAGADSALPGPPDTADAAIDRDEAGNGGATQCPACAIGLQAGEEHGNGLKAIDFSDIHAGTASRMSREPASDPERWLGLTGDFGAFSVGAPSTLDEPHAAMIDPLYRLQGRTDHTIRYNSPDGSGLDAGAAHGAGSDASNGGGTGPIGIGASYSNGGFLAFADYEDNRVTAPETGGDIAAWKVGGKYGLGMFALYGQYEDASIGNRVVAPDYAMAGWHLGASASLGETMASLAYGQGEFDFGGGSADGYSALSLRLTHNLGKGTTLFTGFSEVSCNTRVTDTVCGRVRPSGGEEDMYSLGLEHRF